MVLSIDITINYTMQKCQGLN